ncbi:MAG TPA: hypothetical protein VKB48_06540 [Candidatus Acidoferrum sp.]|nr:hypothetical protein [Candidatus Acidoferrum sp.]
MGNTTSETATKGSRRISLDSWAVLSALIAAALVRFGLIHRIPW